MEARMKKGLTFLIFTVFTAVFLTGCVGSRPEKECG
jgi:hypothetical protein